MNTVRSVLLCRVFQFFCFGHTMGVSRKKHSCPEKKHTPNSPLIKVEKMPIVGRYQQRGGLFAYFWPFSAYIVVVPPRHKYLEGQELKAKMESYRIGRVFSL